jgi:hypothetical protein
VGVASVFIFRSKRSACSQDSDKGRTQWSSRTADGSSACDVALFAYNLPFDSEKSRILGGPEWLASAQYEIQAKIEQFGLWLVPSKAPAEVIVIDHIERLSENQLSSISGGCERAKPDRTSSVALTFKQTVIDQRQAPMQWLDPLGNNVRFRIGYQTIKIGLIGNFYLFCRLRRNADQIGCAADRATPGSRTPAITNGGRAERSREFAYQSAAAPIINKSAQSRRLQARHFAIRGGGGVRWSCIGRVSPEAFGTQIGI